MKRNLIETILGAVVLFVAIFFVVTTYQSSGVKKDYGTKLFANFDKVDGITTGSDVRLGGIKIGSVVGLALDPKSYRARLDIGIQDKIGIPTDSSAMIASDGLLGGKYVNIVPGGDSDMLKNGSQIEFTQSSVNLEEMIGKFAFGSAGGDKAAAKPTGAEDKTSMNVQAAPLSAPVPEMKKPAPAPEPAPQVTQPQPPKKADIVDVAKPAPAAPTTDFSPPVSLPKAEDAPVTPASTAITPKIVKVPQSGDSE